MIRKRLKAADRANSDERTCHPRLSSKLRAAAGHLHASADAADRVGANDQMLSA
jgi:hypothetical protein